jgi:hypothetical protein
MNKEPTINQINLIDAICHHIGWFGSKLYFNGVKAMNYNIESCREFVKTGVIKEEDRIKLEICFNHILEIVKNNETRVPYKDIPDEFKKD